MGYVKPATAKGTRDFGPLESARRTYLFEVLKRRFREFGFQPLETPAIERLDTLTGKYGQEGDALLFKILNSGDWMHGLLSAEGSVPESINSKSALEKVSEKALRYDLTVPFARYVAQNRHILAFPFRRYQIQPVWRADNPQKGRYREFYQCDADIIGSNSLLNEVDLLLLFHFVFSDLGLNNAQIRINNRKVLFGIAEVLGIEADFVQFTQSLDKLDKIGIDGVSKELINRGFTEEKVAEIKQWFTAEAFDLESLAAKLVSSETGSRGVEELRFVFSALKNVKDFTTELVLDFSLARGLNYYTGCIFEVVLPGSGMGSVAAGGRYDDLTGIFGLEGVSGVGISFGADRIYDILLARDLFPANTGDAAELMFLNFGDSYVSTLVELCQRIRAKGISAFVYPDSAHKISKQMTYANKAGVQKVASYGEDEAKEGMLVIKNMQTGEKKKHSLTEI
jgi:histidyl-tRNA synthetase